jgi:hypothetical protein
MNVEKNIAAIEEARAVIRKALAECELPQIQAMLRNADMELHWALWNLGVAVPIRPEQ